MERGQLDLSNAGSAAVVAALIGDGNSPFSSATQNVQLSKSSFDVKTQVGWTAATFDGYAVKVGGTWENGIDAVSGVKTLTMTPPTGGNRWVVGANQTTDEQIFGMRVLDSASGIVVASQLFDDPITLSTPGEQLNTGPVQVPFKDNAMDSSSL